MTEFQQKLQGYKIVTVDIFYYMPDYQSLIQEFIWQTLDQVPQFYRVHQFLNYWHKNIDAVIKEILLSYDPEIAPTKYQNVEHFFSLN
jgi:uncharacterized protein Usg